MNIAVILNTPKPERKLLTYTGLEQFLIQLAIHISRKFYYKRHKSESLVEIIERIFKRMGLAKDTLPFDEKEVKLDSKLQDVLASNSQNIVIPYYTKNISFSPYKASSKIKSKVK